MIIQSIQISHFNRTPVLLLIANLISQSQNCQCIHVLLHCEEDLLTFKLRIRMRKKDDLRVLKWTWHDCWFLHLRNCSSTDFHTELSLGQKGNSSKKRKYPVSSSPVSEKAFFLPWGQENRQEIKRNKKQMIKL